MVTIVTHYESAGDDMLLRGVRLRIARPFQFDKCSVTARLLDDRHSWTSSSVTIRSTPSTIVSNRCLRQMRLKPVTVPKSSAPSSDTSFHSDRPTLRHFGNEHFVVVRVMTALGHGFGEFLHI
jgi:hypothetical protein